MQRKFIDTLYAFFFLLINGMQPDLVFFEQLVTLVKRIGGHDRDQRRAHTIADGHFQADGSFVASEILAKHDENYMPPELTDRGMHKTDAVR